MNVIRPVVMTCWHTDPILKENSAKTGERGKKILTYLKGSINFEKNFEAIYAVASGKSMENADEKLVKVGFLCACLQLRKNSSSQKYLTILL